MAEAVINRLWLRVRRFGDGGQEPIGRVGIINMRLKRNTVGRQEGKIMSDSAVHKENRNMSQYHEHSEGGEIFNLWLLVG